MHDQSLIDRPEFKTKTKANRSDIVSIQVELVNYLLLLLLVNLVYFKKEIKYHYKRFNVIP